MVEDKEVTKKIYVRCEERLHRLVKALCAREGVTINFFVLEAINTKTAQQIAEYATEEQTDRD